MIERRLMQGFVLISCIFIQLEFSACKQVKSSSQRVLITFLDSEPKVNDPYYASDSISQNFHNLTHGSLIRIDRNLKAIPSMVDKMKITQNRIFQFKLKKGLKFHDGTAVTVEDVLTSIKHYAGLIEKDKNDSPHFKVFSKIQKVKKTDELSFEFEIQKSDPFFIHELSLLKIYKTNVDGKIIGCGLFYEFEKKHGEIRLKRFYGVLNDVSHLVTPVEEIHFKIVKEDYTRFQMMKNGEVNFIQNAFSYSMTNMLLDNSFGWKSSNTPGVNVSYIIFNFKDPILSNHKVREAVSRAIDVNEILKYRIQKIGRKATGLLNPLHDNYEPNLIKYEYDPKTAEKLLDEAGYFRKKDGIRFSLEFKTTGEKLPLDLMIIFQEYLKRIGVKVVIKPLEFGTFFSDLQGGSFQLVMSRWIGISNPSIYIRVFSCDEIGKLNRGAYCNRNLEEMFRSLDHEEKANHRKIWSEIQKLVAIDLPYVVLWNWTNTVFYQPIFKNIVPYPNGNYLLYAEVETEVEVIQ